MWIKTAASLGALLTPAPVSSASTYMGGFAYDPDGRLHVVNDTPDAGDPRLGGLAATPTGALYITTDEPDPKFCNAGLITDSDGRVYVVDATGAASHEFGGLPFTSTEGLNADSPIWEFNAALGGTLAATCSVEPTITRAGNTATAVNSSGLIAVVNANLPRFDYDPVTLALRGLLVEEARTNVALHNADFTNAVWVKSNVTAAKDQTGPDGVANSASSLTATAANGAALQSITLASSARYQSAYVKRITGSGTVNMTMDNGATWTAVTVTSAWTRVEIPTQTLANPIVGFRLVTSGDAIAVYGLQNENGAFATSLIAIAGASTVTRAADVITLATASIPGFSAATLTMYVEARGHLDQTTAGKRIWALSDGTTTERLFLTYRGDNDTVRFSVTDGGVAQVNDISLGVGSEGVAFKAAIAAAVNDFAGSLNGAAVVTDSAGTMPAMPTLNIGSSELSAAHVNAPIKKLRLYNVRKSNAALPAMTQ